MTELKRWLRYSQLIALQVLERMSELGMTQKQLSEKMNCSQQYVSILLKGSENLTLETIAKLEDALEMEIIGHVHASLVSGYVQRESVHRYLSELESPSYGEK
ncbi:MAG: helix-turn-helix transcriptional regulator [Bacteroidales bacterium]|nr:helix-turn-helix transcriptional regulator [Bacteroidales bacterium]